MTPRLKELYYKEIQPSLKEKLGFKNTYMGPKLEKVVINMGLGLDGNDAKTVKSCEELGFIKFGSRVDVFLPVGTKIVTELNEKVKGGISIIAKY